MMRRDCWFTYRVVLGKRLLVNLLGYSGLGVVGKPYWIRYCRLACWVRVCKWLLVSLLGYVEKRMKCYHMRNSW